MNIKPVGAYRVITLTNPHFMVHYVMNSVTRLGNLLHFGQLFKACGNNYFRQITHIFCKGVKMFHFSIEIIFRQL